MQGYRYTPGSDEKPIGAKGRLTSQQRAFYEKNGFLVIPKLVSKADIEMYRKRFLDIIEGRVQYSPRLLMMKDVSLRDKKDVPPERLVYKLQNLAYEDILGSYVDHSDVLDFVENFTGPNITAMHTMLINKPPDAGTLTSRHPWHQDLHYFPFRPADRIVASWTAMEKIDGANGCLCVFPGTHRSPGELLRHDYPQREEGGVNKMFHGVRDPKATAEANRVELHMEAGDTVFFHPLLVHGSGPNKSGRFRKAISTHYASSDCCDYIDVTGTQQEAVADEVRTAYVKKWGKENVTFADTFRLKSREVRGPRGKL